MLQKQYRFLALVLLLPLSSFSQKWEKLFIETNLLRCTREPGLMPEGNHALRFRAFNGLLLGYALSPRARILAGVRRLPELVRSGRGDEGENATQKGAEWTAGFEWSLLPVRSRLLIAGAMGLFYQEAKEEGTYWVDYPPQYRIYHRNRYYGLCPELKIGCRLTGRLSVLAAARIRVGRFSSHALIDYNSGYPVYRDQDELRAAFEPLGSLGLRVRL